MRNLLGEVWEPRGEVGRYESHVGRYGSHVGRYGSHVGRVEVVAILRGRFLAGLLQLVGWLFSQLIRLGMNRGPKNSTLLCSLLSRYCHAS